jgi:DNA adenine methylase
MMSLNHHPEILRVFAGFEIDIVPSKYCVGGGAKTVERSEVIIYSWDRSLDPVELF